MPKKMTKRWWTIAWLTREGVPHPVHWYENFSQRYCTAKVLVEDTSYGMRNFARGAYASVIWPGQLSEQEALHGDTRPAYQVYEGGRVEKVT